MKTIDKLFHSACERCEEWSAYTQCEVQATCPVYKLYVAAKGKEKVKVVRASDWAVPPTPRPEMI